MITSLLLVGLLGTIVLLVAAAADESFGYTGHG